MKAIILYKATALRLIIDDIRSKSQYSQKYAYVGSDGVYEREYTVGNENDNYYMPVTINEMAVTDKVVKIQFSVGSGVYESKTVFDSNGNFKF